MLKAQHPFWQLDFMNLILKVEETIFFKFQTLKFTKGICAADLEASWSSINQ
jgi:hypothetical protein